MGTWEQGIINKKIAALRKYSKSHRPLNLEQLNTLVAHMADVLIFEIDKKETTS